MSSPTLEGFRLSPQQRELVRRGTAARAACALVMVDGRLDADRFEAALAAAVDRHEILRTHFRRPPGVSLPVQVIAEPGTEGAKPHLERRGDGDVGPPAGRPDDLLRNEAAVAFDLEHGPMVRAVLSPVDGGRHALVLAVPYVAGDAWSLGSLLREVAGLYAGGDSGAGEELLQYADFAEWQNELREEGDEGYWAELETPPHPALPWSRAAAADGAPEAVRWRLPATLVGRLVETVEGRLDPESAVDPLEAAVLAAWSAVLARRGGMTAVTVGGEWHGRSLEPLLDAQGPVARVLPVPCRPAPDRPVAEVAAEVAAVLAEIRGWAEQFDWQRLQDGGAGPGPSAEAAGGTFTASFAWRPRGEPVRAGDVVLHPVREHCFPEPAPVHLVVGRDGTAGDLRLEIGFHPSALPVAEAGRLAADLDGVLRRAAAAPGGRLEELGLPARPVCHREAVEHNDTAAPCPDRRLDELVSAAAERWPDEPAVILGGPAGGEGEWSRRRLEDRASRLAGVLTRRGVGVGRTVALLLDRSPELLELVLATWKAGAAYVALDPGHPDARLAWILEDADAALVVTRRRWARRLPEGVPVVAVEDLEPSAGEPVPAVARCPASPDDPAYVVYTSGSTGRPKGICAAHRGAVSYLGSMLERHGLGSGDVVLQVAAPSFDASLRDMVGSLASGARLVLLDDASARTPRALMAALRRHRVTAVLSLVPTLLRELLAVAEAEGGGPLPDLRLVLLSGEVLYAEDVERVARVFGPRVEVVNQYGPSETTMTATFQPVAGLDDGSGQGLPVGRPIPNVRLLLLDRALRPVAPGAVGEVFLGGVGVTRGYLRRPALTAERFLPDPHGPAGARLYRTGDLARRRPDGGLDFLGRLDTQVKLRGLRIEPGEIETVLRRLEGVQAAVVAPWGEGDERRLVAYFVPSSDPAPSPAELRRGLARDLPEYLVPAAFVEMDELPRTASGKVDRKALPEPSREAEPDAYVSPRNPQEELVAAIWADVLRCPRVGVEDDFFALGGHSLIATRVVARVGDACGVDLPLQAIFDHPTVAALAREVERLRSAGGGLVAPPIEPVSREGRLPLSTAQQRVWFQERLHPGSPALLVPELLDLDGVLDREALGRALDRLEERHETLRTRFPEEDGDVRQEVLPPRSRLLPLVDLAELPEAARAAEVERVGAAFSFRPFDLASAPGWRAGLLRTGPRHHRLMVTFHYLLVDGWSSGIFISELIELYGALPGVEPQLPEQPLDYADYAVWQRAWLEEGGGRERLEEFWRERVTPPPPRLDLPADRPGAAAGGPAGGVRFDLGPELSAELAEACRRWGATPFMVLLAAFQSLLARLGGTTDVTVGTLSASRIRPELEGIMGLFVNNLVLRTSLDGDPAFDEVVARCRRTLLDAFHHQELPMDRVEALHRRGGGSGSPFQVLFVFQNLPRPSVPDLDLEVRPVILEREERAERDLALALEEREGRLVGTLRYNSDRFDRETVEGLVERFRRFLAEGLANPERRLSELPLLDPEERRRLLEEWPRRGGAPVAAELAPGWDGERAWVLDPSRHPLPVNAPGEIHLELPEDARPPAGTAAIAVPWDPRLRLWPSGERGVWRRDGRLDRLADPAATEEDAEEPAEEAAVEERWRQVEERKEKLTGRKQALLQGLLGGKGGAVEESRNAIPRRPPGEPAPLSFAQERLWFLSRLEPSAATYNVSLVFKLTGTVDVVGLATALLRLVQRHEVLRSRFPEVGGQPRQVVEPTRLPLHRLDLSALPEDLRRPAVRQQLRRLGRLPFDLEAGPVLKSYLLRREPERHYLLLNLHHSVSDAWSGGILRRELVAFYAEATGGPAAELPELPIQYADFAAWQRKAAEGEWLERQLAFWRRTLEGAPERLDLPFDRPRPAVQTTRGGLVPLDLPHRLLEDLQRRCREEGVTAFVFLLAAFQAWIHRLTGATDVVVGSPVAGRHRQELEDLVGLFLNTLVLRNDLSGNPPFRELLQRTRKRVNDAQTHQELPFERLVAELQPRRSLAHSPLFQVMLSYQAYTAAREMAPPGSGMGGLKVERRLPDQGTAKFDVTLSLSETASRLLGGIEYNSDLFDRTTVERFGCQLGRLLAAVVDDPELRVSQLPLLGPAQHQHLLVEWNDLPRASRAPEWCVHDRVVEVAGEAPSRPAVVVGGGVEQGLRFWELEAESARLAQRLVRRGVRRGAVVALLVDRSPAAAAAMLGVLRAGAACLPLDPGYPEVRLALMLEDSAVEVVVVSEERAGSLPVAWDGTVVGAEDGGTEGRTEGAAAPAALPEVGPDDLAYVLYTSGSTGRPKGVAMTHRGLANLVDGQLGRRPMAAGTRVLWFAPLSFDVSFQEVFTTLCGGGTLVTAPEEVRRDPEQLLELLARERVEHLYLPFVALQNLSVAARGGGTLPSSLREIFTAGEQLRVTPAVEELFRSVPACRLHNQYGPTETHVVSEETLEGDPERWPRLPAIGRPVEGLRLRVLDRYLRDVPPGVPGELFLGGVGVARGYLGRPALTAAAFLPEPHVPATGSRLYRTGDRARWLADGRVEFLGRMDAQVKVRGFRIEPGEVESALEAHPAVASAAVTVRGTGSADRRLVAWIVPAGSEPPDPQALAEFLARRLPSYMVPGEVRWLASLPLTPSGKVDRRALPAEGGERLRGDAPARPPETPEEELLAMLWREVLGLEEISAEDDFFALGGHSLLATRLVSRVRETFRVELPLKAVFQAPTLAALARRLAELQRGEGKPLPPVVAGAPRPAPLSYAQERLWFMDRLTPGDPAYNMPLALRVRGPLDPSALAAAFGALVERHEVLRTTYREALGSAVQVVHPPAPVPLPLVDLSALPAERREDELLRWVRSEARRPFDLAAGPVLRTLLLRLPGGTTAEDHALLANFHHVAVDGWSLEVLTREMRELYAAAVAGRPPALEPLPVQYADFATWQRRHLDGERLGRDLDAWRRTLEGVPDLDLPTDHPAPEHPSRRGGVALFRIPEERAASLDALGREAGTTAFMTLLAAFFALLARWTGQSDLAVGTNVAGRSRLETEGLVGFFVNNLVLRARAGEDTTFRQLLDQVRERVLQGFAHQEVPFDLLVRELQPERQEGTTPLFRVLFVMQNTGDSRPPDRPTAAAEGAVVLEPLSTGWDLAKFDLSLFITPDEGSYRGRLVYRRELFEPTTMERLVRRYNDLVEAVSDRPDTRIDHLERMSDVEKTEMKKSDLSSLRKVRRRGERRAPAPLVDKELAVEGANLPLMIRPRNRDLELAGWAAANRPALEEDLLRHGALMFRGWGMDGIGAFEAFAAALTDELFGEYGDLPKEDEGEKVYHSTPYRSDKIILFHNESSHMHRWPMHQFFHCVQAARERGETPIVDCREVYQRLDPELRQRFEEKKLMYVRNFVSGLDVSWQDFFKTEDRSEVEAYCRRAGLELEWRGDHLQTRQIAPAVARHPQTGEKVFFNQIQLHHKAALDPDIRESMEQVFEEDAFPRNVRFGDGEPIPDRVVEEVTRLYWDCSVALPWEEGDTLMVDNMLVAHARNPFVGPRKIVVAMGDILDSRKVS